MSAAFDTINIRHLLETVKTIVDEDEYTLTQFLLSGTVIETRINGTSSSKLGNVGTPFGESLNPVLFIIDLVPALLEFRSTLPRPTTPSEAEIPNEIACTDDVDFTVQSYAVLWPVRDIT